MHSACDGQRVARRSEAERRTSPSRQIIINVHKAQSVFSLRLVVLENASI